MAHVKYVNLVTKNQEKPNKRPARAEQFGFTGAAANWISLGIKCGLIVDTSGQIRCSQFSL